MEYSGRTTAYEHHGDDWKTRQFVPRSAIQTETVFHVQWSDCPVEVRDAVRELWIDNNLGNDHYFYAWEDLGESEVSPIISEYLKSKGITKCMILYWW